jgi:hypothetical protein
VSFAVNLLKELWLYGFIAGYRGFKCKNFSIDFEFQLQLVLRSRIRQLKLQLKTLKIFVTGHESPVEQKRRSSLSNLKKRQSFLMKLRPFFNYFALP